MMSIYVGYSWYKIKVLCEVQRQNHLASSSDNNLIQIPHLFNQNNKVDKYNEKVHHLATGVKCTIKAQDSVVGANSAELRDKIMKQIPNDPRKTRQIISNLTLAKVERTELVVNARIQDGMTNGAGNIVKKISLHQSEKPSGITWVRFDDANVGEKNRRINKVPYTQRILKAKVNTN